MKNKVTLIPGWMGLVENYGRYEGLEIWKENILEDYLIKTEYVVGHSLGAHFALLNWNKNKNTKLILVNPLLEKKSLFGLFYSWLRYMIYEGAEWQNKLILDPILILRGVGKAIQYSKIDLMEYIKKIPLSELVVIRGKKDLFYCDEEAFTLLDQSGIQIIEVDGVGHNWHRSGGEFDGEIKKIVNS